MTAASLAKIKEEAFIPDPTSYDIPTVSLVMLDECSCIRHVMSTSLEPEDAVEAALSAAITMNTCRYAIYWSSYERFKFLARQIFLRNFALSLHRE